MSRTTAGDGTFVTYAPKRDWWVLLLMWGVVAMIAWSAIGVSREHMEPLARSLTYLALAGGIALCLAPLYTLAYTLSDEFLRVGFGPIGMRVPLGAIESVTPGFAQGFTTNWSMSLMGLVIAQRGRRMRVAIAPLSEETFLCDLASRCPHLELRDGELTRRD